MRRLLLVASLVALFAAPSAQAATKRAFWFQNALVVGSFWDQIGQLPVNDILKEGNRYRAGTTTYVVNWVNSLTNRRTTSQALKQSQRGDMVYTDRALSAREKRRWKRLVDLARDAHVVVVSRENPVCQSGLTRAQARGIARGEITRWSQVATLPDGFPDTIVRRISGSDGFADAHFGAPAKPGRALVAPDAGMAAIRGGHRAVAGFTAWSKARFGGVCVVPINGVQPTNASVHALRYPEALPIHLVIRRRNGKPKLGVKAYVAFMTGAYVTRKLRERGVLLAKDSPGADTPAGGGLPGPPYSADGRPITTVQDDEGVRSVVAGARIDREGVRYAFEADGTLYQLVDDGTSCARTQGTWELLIGWRYGEYGGGVVAKVRIANGDTRESTLEITSSGTAYLDGQPYTHDRASTNACG